MMVRIMNSNTNINNISVFLREKILPFVQTPGQYLGGETNAVVKENFSGGKFCMIFPDTYSIGMSCHAVQVLYNIMNSQPNWVCERAFAPMTDMEKLVRAYNLPWFSLETKTALKDFDVLGFTLQHELCYTNVLTILDISQISITSENRAESAPLILAGGPCAWNPEPLADIFDAFIIGDGEQAQPLLCNKWRELRLAGVSRKEALHQMAAAFNWLYVPCCYKPDENFRPVPIYPDVPAKIEPAVVPDLEAYPLPVNPVVPWVEAVQDRVAVEVMRGCPWKCRFCQSNPIKRPVRIRKPETVCKAVEQSIAATGYEEVTLLSLSTGDYPKINEVIQKLDKLACGCPMSQQSELEQSQDDDLQNDLQNADNSTSESPADGKPQRYVRNFSVSVPSLRINRHLTKLGEVLRTQKHSGLTLAVEAAKEDMREIIGKPITNDDLLEGCKIAFSRGFQRVKMYFMCGFPGENNADLDAIFNLAEIVAKLGKDVSGRWPKVVISVSNLVPKPHSPFQWYPMQTREYFNEAGRYLRHRRLPTSISVKSHDVECSLLEGIMCRGDRRVGAAVIEAWKQGAKFDSWTDQFRPDIWEAAIETVGLDVKAILHKQKSPGDTLPWDFIEIRQGRQYLEKEFTQSLAEVERRKDAENQP